MQTNLLHSEPGYTVRTLAHITSDTINAALLAQMVDALDWGLRHINWPEHMFVTVLGEPLLVLETIGPEGDGSEDTMVAAYISYQSMLWALDQPVSQTYTAILLELHHCMVQALLDAAGADLWDTDDTQQAEFVAHVGGLWFNAWQRASLIDLMQVQGILGAKYPVLHNIFWGYDGPADSTDGRPPAEVESDTGPGGV